MKRAYFIGLDTHGSFCAMAVVDGGGKLLRRGECKTTISKLRELLGKAPRPRRLAFEKGPLANWL